MKKNSFFLSGCLFLLAFTCNRCSIRERIVFNESFGGHYERQTDMESMKKTMIAMAREKNPSQSTYGKAQQDSMALGMQIANDSIVADGCFPKQVRNYKISMDTSFIMTHAFDFDNLKVLGSRAVMDSLRMASKLTAARLRTSGDSTKSGVAAIVSKENSNENIATTYERTKNKLVIKLSLSSKKIKKPKEKPQRQEEDSEDVKNSLDKAATEREKLAQPPQNEASAEDKEKEAAMQNKMDAVGEAIEKMYFEQTWVFPRAIKKWKCKEIPAHFISRVGNELTFKVTGEEVELLEKLEKATIEVTFE